GPSLCHLDKELLHVPGTGRAALGAETAVQADILVLDHDPPGLQRIANIEILREIGCRSAKTGAQLRFLAIFGKGDAIHRADVDASIALDAQLAREDSLDIAVEAALGFEIGELVVKPELDLGLDVLQRDRNIA